MSTCADCYYRRTLFMPLFFETHLSERPHARARRKKAVEEGGSATRLLRVSGLASVSVQAAWRPRKGARSLSLERRPVRWICCGKRFATSRPR
jgi:hypothetical protein